MALVAMAWFATKELLEPHPSPVARADMVLVPAGWFVMGCYALKTRPVSTSEWTCHDSGPLRRVYLDGFLIDRFEVTEHDYSVCVAAGACAPRRGTADAPDSAVHVTWPVADAYCRFRGAELPTEAQWEKAGRGTDGRLFPWGDNFEDGQLRWSLLGRVGQSPRDVSSYGVFDLLGNAEEMVADPYDRVYRQSGSQLNPRALKYGGSASHVVKGAGGLLGMPLYHHDRALMPTDGFSGSRAGFRCAFSL